MLQRVEGAGTFPVRSVSAVPIERILPAAGSMLALPWGEVAGEFRASGRVDKRRREIYELLVANNTPTPIATFAYALEGRADSRVTWDAIVVPAYSAVAVDIDVPLTPAGHRPRMIAEVYAHDSQLTLDAQTPAINILRRGLARRAVAAFCAFVAIASGSVAYAAMRPQVMALAAPPTVPGGTSFSVAFAARGTSDTTYSVATPDGRQIAGGSLDSRADAFMVAVPKNAVSQGYDVRVTARNSLGNDTRTIHVLALAPGMSKAAFAKSLLQPARAVRVWDVAVQNESVDGGQPIVVTYRSSVPSGTIRLIDQYGTVRGEGLMSGRGRSTLAAPFVDADQDLRIVVSAERDGERAAAAVPVTVRHVDQAAAGNTPRNDAFVPPLGAAQPPSNPGANFGPADAAAAPSDALPQPTVPDPVPVSGDEQPVATAEPPIAVSAAQVSGSPVRVHILHHDAGLHISMMGPGGDEVVSENVSPGASSVLLAAPDLGSSHGRGYSIVATFTRGVSEETLILPITFHAP